MTPRNRRRLGPWLSLWLPVAAWMALIFYLSAQPDLPHPGISWADQFFSIGAHTFVFGVLCFLWARALGGRPRALLIAFCLTALYALSDEFHQSFVPGRTPDPLDLLCDGLGAVIGLWLWVQVRRRFRI